MHGAENHTQWAGGRMHIAADLRDTGDAFVMEADLPGFEKENIQIDIEGNCLKIKAERRPEPEEKDAEGSVLRRQRTLGSRFRRFPLSGVREEDITASYENGVLKLVMPKKETSSPNTRRLEIQ